MTTSDQRSLQEVVQMMRGLGAGRIFAKSLAANDNSKNQVYLGGDFELLSVLPSGDPEAGSSGTHSKPIFKSTLRLAWMNENWELHPAPSTQLILYPQYPEVRLSGFLKGASWAPSDIMTVREPGRVLLLGVCNNDTVIAYAANSRARVADEVQRCHQVRRVGVLVELAVDGKQLSDARSRLMAALCRTASKGWIDPWRLSADGSRSPCNGTNCVGVTLESELGISGNGRSEPDFDGWEVKAHTVTSFVSRASGVLTLLTPEPNLGEYVSEGVEAFIRKYGYPDVSGRPDRINFGGVHRVGETSDRTQLRMELHGFDAERGSITDANGSLVLLNSADEVAAGWNFAGLLAHWKRKHSRAVFVRAMKMPGQHVRFRYSENVELGIDTDYAKLLSGLANQTVYYDPGIKLENASTSPRTKRRSQFRIKTTSLRRLYKSFEQADACA